jgi:hypothetical protein
LEAKFNPGKQAVHVMTSISHVLQLDTPQIAHSPDTYNPHDSLQPVQMPGAAGQVRQFISLQAIEA